MTSYYTMPDGTKGFCRILRTKDGFVEVVDLDCGAILWLRPEWIED